VVIGLVSRRFACRRLAASLAIVVALAGCSTAAGLPASDGPGASAPTTSSSGPPPSASLTVFAGASLEAALTNAIRTYEAEHVATTITLSTDSSAALAAKIVEGAPADLFLAADVIDPQTLVEAGLAVGPVQPFARNRLTVVVPAGNPAGLERPVDLGRPGVKVVAAGDRVPITTYANQLVANLARQAGYPGDFAAAYGANIVSREDNVAAVISKIELGEGDAAIVYVTDAKASSRVQVIPIPDGANVQATYGGVVVRASASPAAARAFLSWLAGPGGQAVLASFGFLAAT
jgi:molybdate transport system substrate-binding protein